MSVSLTKLDDVSVWATQLQSENTNHIMICIVPFSKESKALVPIATHFPYGRLIQFQFITYLLPTIQILWLLIEKQNNHEI